MFRKILNLEEKETPVSFNVISEKFRDKIVAVNDFRELWWGKVEFEEFSVIELAYTRNFLYDGNDETLKIKRKITEDCIFKNKKAGDVYILEKVISELNEDELYICYRLSSSYHVYSGKGLNNN